MSFYKKLDLIMKVQGVSNSRLARSLSVDPSLVSRWRTGARQPAKNTNYIKNISIYFAEHAAMEYQKIALFEIMGIEYNKADDSNIPELLYEWFSEDNSSDSKLVEGFFEKLELSRNIKTPFPESVDIPTPTGKQPDIEVFNGIEGKRKGVIKFLTIIAGQNKPCTLLLYSDEDMEWLTADKSFVLKWKALLMTILAKGHRIKIIHTINRNLSEMLAAIEQWLPLYMTGSIEPYYYPKYQENIFKRTMFIAPDVAALTSSTLSEHTDKAEQFLYLDKEMINNLTEEFNEYLKMCRPLMRIYTGNKVNEVHKLQIEFEEQSGETISLSDSLSSITMTESLFSKIINRSDITEDMINILLSLHRERADALKLNLKNSNFTEILALPSKEELSIRTKFPKPSDLFVNLDLSCTPLDYIEHLENIIKMLEEYDNYNVLLINKLPSDNIYISYKEEVGVIIAKNDKAPTIFALNQARMTNSFNTYLEDIIKGIRKKERDKDYIIDKLKKYIDVKR